jgi:diacylglycerol O-acyltransferase-1
MLKLISYAHVMRTIRYAVERIKSLEGKKVPLNDFFKESEVSTEVFFYPIYNVKNLEIIKKQIKKPVNLVNFQHFLYFLAAPTLCF